MPLTAKNQELFINIQQININDAPNIAMYKARLQDLISGLGEHQLNLTKASDFLARANNSYPVFTRNLLGNNEVITAGGPPSAVEIFNIARHTLFLLNQVEEINKIKYESLTPEKEGFLIELSSLDTGNPRTANVLITHLRGADYNLFSITNIEHLKKMAQDKLEQIQIARIAEQDKQKDELNRMLTAAREKCGQFHDRANLLHENFTSDVFPQLSTSKNAADLAQNHSEAVYNQDRKNTRLKKQVELDTRAVAMIEEAQNLARQMRDRLEHRVLERSTAKYSEWDAKLDALSIKVNDAGYNPYDINNKKIGIQQDLREVKTLCAQIDELSADLDRAKELVRVCQLIATNPSANHGDLMKPANCLIKIRALTDTTDYFQEKIVRSGTIDDRATAHGLEGQVVYRGVYLQKGDVKRTISNDEKICIEQYHTGLIIDRCGAEGRVKFVDLTPEQQELSAMEFAKALLLDYKPGSKEPITLNGGPEHAKQASMVHAALLLLTAPEKDNEDYIKFNPKLIKVNVQGAEKPTYLFKWQNTFIKEHITRNDAAVAGDKKDLTQVWVEKYKQATTVPPSKSDVGESHLRCVNSAGENFLTL